MVLGLVGGVASNNRLECDIQDPFATNACDPDDNNPCCGNGECKSEGEKYYCDCDSGFAGRFCDIAEVEVGNEFEDVIRDVVRGLPEGATDVVDDSDVQAIIDAALNIGNGGIVDRIVREEIVMRLKNVGR